MLKLFELKDDQLYTLFHAAEYKGSRQLPLDTWLTATERQVTDGSSQTPYLSGFHFFFCDHSTIQQYCARFTQPRKLVLVDVLVKDTRPKPTNPNVWLARRIFIPSNSPILHLENF